MCYLNLWFDIYLIWKISIILSSFDSLLFSLYSPSGIYITFSYFSEFSNICLNSQSFIFLWTLKDCFLNLTDNSVMWIFSSPVFNVLRYGHNIFTPCIPSYFWLSVGKFMWINLKITWGLGWCYCLSKIIYHSADGLMALLCTGHLIPIHD